MLVALGLKVKDQSVAVGKISISRSSSKYSLPIAFASYWKNVPDGSK